MEPIPRQILQWKFEKLKSLSPEKILPIKILTHLLGTFHRKERIFI